MERKYFKALNFDLDTHQLKEHYPGANYRQAYDDLRRFFKRHRFSHRQGSGYISDDKLATADIYDLMDETGCMEFDIAKGRFSFRLTAPYSEERREAARRYARENNAADRLK